MQPQDMKSLQLNCSEWTAVQDLWCRTRGVHPLKDKETIFLSSSHVGIWVRRGNYMKYYANFRVSSLKTAITISLRRLITGQRENSLFPRSAIVLAAAQLWAWWKLKRGPKDMELFSRVHMLFVLVGSGNADLSLSEQLGIPALILAVREKIGELWRRLVMTDLISCPAWKVVTQIHHTPAIFPRTEFSVDDWISTVHFAFWFSTQTIFS